MTGPPCRGIYSSSRSHVIVVSHVTPAVTRYSVFKRSTVSTQVPPAVASIRGISRTPFYHSQILLQFTYRIYPAYPLAYTAVTVQPPRGFSSKKSFSSKKLSFPLRGGKVTARTFSIDDPLQETRGRLLSSVHPEATLYAHATGLRDTCASSGRCQRTVG